jgi:hypothetical protein
MVSQRRCWMAEPAIGPDTDRREPIQNLLWQVLCQAGENAVSPRPEQASLVSLDADRWVLLRHSALMLHMLRTYCATHPLFGQSLVRSGPAYQRRQRLRYQRRRYQRRRHHTVSILPLSAGARSRGATVDSASAAPTVTARIPADTSIDVTNDRRSIASFSSRKRYDG